MPEVTVKIALVGGQPLGLTVEKRTLTVIGYKGKSPCEGKILVGDRFLLVNQHPVTDIGTFQKLVKLGNKGKPLEFVIERKEALKSQKSLKSVKSLKSTKTVSSTISSISVEAEKKRTKLKIDATKCEIEVDRNLVATKTKDCDVAVGDTLVTFDGKSLLSPMHLQFLFGKAKKSGESNVPVEVLKAKGEISELQTQNVALQLRKGEEKLGFSVSKEMCVKDVQKGSIADGMLLSGDVITHFDKKQVKSTKDIASLWKSTPKEENKSLILTILRAKAVEKSTEEQTTKMDLNVILNEDRYLGLHLKRDLRVKGVAAGSPGDRIFKIGDRITHVNSVRMESVKDFNKYWEKNKGETLRHKFTVMRTTGGESSKNEESTAAVKSPDSDEVNNEKTKAKLPDESEDEGFVKKTLNLKVKLNEDRKLGIRLSAKLIVERIEKDSSADGVVQVGDLVTHLNGLKMDSNKDFLSLWKDFAGKEPQFTVVRKEELLKETVAVELKLKENEKLGIAADDNLKIAQVKEKSPAEGALKVDDQITHVNEIKVETNERFSELLAKCEGGNLKITVLRSKVKEDSSGDV